MQIFESQIRIDNTAIVPVVLGISGPVPTYIHKNKSIAFKSDRNITHALTIKYRYAIIKRTSVRHS
jgi:hypothetical protein